MNLAKTLHYFEFYGRRLKRRVSHGYPQPTFFRHYLVHLTNVGDRFSQGIVNVTVDLELACGRSQATTLQVEKRRGQIARRVFMDFMRLADEYTIPITFAASGHLFLDSCQEGSHYLPPASAYGRSDCPEHAWSSRDVDKYTYAPDLIERILKTKRVIHEIASHGFLHVNFAFCDEAVARKELEAYQHAASRFGIRATTFIFPDNQPGHLPLLKEFGYKSYRHHTNGELALDTNGLLRVPTGLWLSPYAANAKELALLIDLVCEKKVFAHLWMHLAEFEYGFDQLHHVLSPLFGAICSARERGVLNIHTLAGVSQLWRTIHGK